MLPCTTWGTERPSSISDAPITNTLLWPSKNPTLQLLHLLFFLVTSPVLSDFLTLLCFSCPWQRTHVLCWQLSQRTPTNTYRYYSFLCLPCASPAIQMYTYKHCVCINIVPQQHCWFCEVINHNQCSQYKCRHSQEYFLIFSMHSWNALQHEETMHFIIIFFSISTAHPMVCNKWKWQHHFWTFIQM